MSATDPPPADAERTGPIAIRPKNHQPPRESGRRRRFRAESASCTRSSARRVRAVHAFGVDANVPVPRRLSVPDLVTTLEATPKPSGVEASRRSCDLHIGKRTRRAGPSTRARDSARSSCRCHRFFVVTYELKPRHERRTSGRVLRAVTTTAPGVNRRNSDQCRRAASGIDVPSPRSRLTASPGWRSRGVWTRPRRSSSPPACPTFMTMSTARFNPARMIRSRVRPSRSPRAWWSVRKYRVEVQQSGSARPDR